MYKKYTPGPWTNNGEGIIVDRHGDIATICAPYDLGSDKSRGTQEANARLIAAAPDLLYALESLVRRLKRSHPGFETKSAKEAIAKATGGELC